MKGTFAVLLLLAFVFISCSGTPELERTVIARGYDFSSYTAKGFMFTPDQYLQSYEAIGLIEIEITPEIRKAKSQPDTLRSSKFREVPETVERLWIEDIEPDFISKEMYQRATKMGADAVVKLEIYTEEKQHGTIKVPVRYISGFAIKRK